MRSVYVSGLFALLASAAMLTSESSQASSNNIVWDVFTTQEGTLLRAKQVKSFLGSEQIKETIIMTAVCTPQKSYPLVTVMIRSPNGQEAPKAANLKFQDPDGNWIPFRARLDRAASANAGDNLPRYLFQMPIDTDFFKELAKEGSRYHPKFDRDPHGGGTRLKIYRSEDRSKVSRFIDSCKRYAGVNTSSNTSQQSANLCRDRLNGPNIFAAGEPVQNYGDAIANQVCGELRSHIGPAVCMHYVMSGRIAYDSQGRNKWAPENAARLCRENQNTQVRLDCFNQQIAAGHGWNNAIETCRNVN
ncbi:MAG: hypothetical protein AAGF54_05105 [Pseudomonadota bacterium]